ncbi:MFS transporter [Microbacterium sp. EST19A]|uniref:MFS transporter n=1 Tax=Microbacterium sp. EST19A TaxID=2862681 RepID=UPI001CBABC71|nr:MFS transporter [Microbacterium sp. EST19A]
MNTSIAVEGTSLDTAVPASPGTLRRVVVSGAIGNFVEWYDLAVYAYAAVIISTTFFPTDNPQVGLIATFVMFAVTYAIRPLSGIIMGVLGDRLGRKRLLVFSILTMAAGTTAIGLLPDYSTIGIAAPILLLACRVVQGIAAGGEFVGAATYVYEYAPAERRGFLLGLIQMGTGLCYPAAAFLSFGIASAVGPEAFAGGAWRVLFLLSAPLALVALYIRVKLTESPVFKALEAAQEVSKSPLKDSLQSNPRRLVSAIAYLLGYFGGAIMLLFFVPTYLTSVVGVDPQHASLLMGFTTLVFAVFIPVFGLLVDRTSRTASRLVSAGLHAALAIPAFVLIGGGSDAAMYAGLFLLAVLQSYYYAVGPLTAVDAFPAKIRFTSGTIAYNIPAAAVPAFLPALSALLVAQTGLNFAPGFVILALSLVGVVGALGLRGTRERSQI